MKGKAYWKAVNAGVSWETFSRLISIESNWNPKAVNKKTGDYGLVQINPRYHDVTIEQALDEDFALDWAIEKFKNNQQHIWVPCNCYLFAMLKVGTLPRMSEIVPNSPPSKGGLVILHYKKVKHIAYIIEVMPGGVYVSESNFKACAIGERFISFDDPHLTGFWFPHMET